MATEPAGRVLVIDDNPESVALIRAQLRRSGYGVMTEANGRVGIEAALADPPDVVLVDVMMPEMDGFEVCRRLRDHPVTHAVPILVLTALHARTDKIRALDAGADDFLSKPVDRAELLARVGSLMRQKRTFDELTQERATLSSIMSSINDGVVVVDPSRSIRYCNGRAGEFLGIDPVGAIGLSIDAAYAHLATRLADAAPVNSAWEQAVASPEERPSLDVTLAQPTQRDLRIEFFPMVGATDLAFGVLLRDMTKERAAERLKDELVSVVSHELRTPLASLVGFAELLLVRPFGEEERREFLNIMLEEGRRLTELINDFLDLQRMESGRQAIAPVATHLASVIERAVISLGQEPERPIAVDVPNSLPRVFIDGDRVQQVLTNLISNARKFSPAGGQIEISGRVVESAAAGPAVEIAVRDHGLGIPPEALVRVFEKFYRVDSGDRREIKGTGLGLAISRQIIEAHGGRLWAESDGLGKGACFRFTLPLAVAGGFSGDVLLIEDDASFARLLSEELAAFELTTVRVPNAEAALQRVAINKPRAIVLDLMLPGQDGELVLPDLHQAIGPTVPIVVVTVKDLLPAERDALEQYGVATVLRKGPRVAVRAARAVYEKLRDSSAPVAE
ncbi:MAG: response regulator [Chloroflexota bacterium]|nr:MAG: response regulator [Chloroflexota bacterium]